jgi:segregation and condensation protein A
VLELTRLKKLRIQQDEAFTDIVCTAVEDTPATEASATETPAEENPLETPADPATVATQDEESHPSPES